MPPLLLWWLAQAAPSSGGGLSPLTQVLIAVLGGGVAVALIDWYRNRNKDEADAAQSQAQAAQIEAQRKSIVEDINEVVWQRTQKELERADRDLEEERAARKMVESRASLLEAELQEVQARLRLMEQRIAEEQSEAYSALLEAIPDAIVQVGQYGRIKTANAAAVQMFGYERDEMVRMEVTDLMPERYREHHRNGFNKAVRTGRGKLLKAEHPTRLKALHADGHEFDIALRLSMFGKCFTAVIRPYYGERNGGSLELVDFPEPSG